MSRGPKYPCTFLKACHVLYLVHVELRSSDPAAYNDVTSILGFFETAGYIVSRKFITADEIVGLYGETLLDEVDRLCSRHIQSRIEESQAAAGMPTKLWRHTCTLLAEARRIYGMPPNT